MKHKSKKSKPAPAREVTAALIMTSKAHKEQQSAKSKRAAKSAAALAAQAETVADAPFKSSDLPKYMKDALHYERTAAPSTADSKFRVGDIAVIERKRCVCYRVNDCRACFVALNTRSVAFETVDGQQVDFVATTDNTISISPNADIDIVKSLGADWKSKLGQQPEQKESMSTKTAPKERKRKSAAESSNESSKSGSESKSGYTSLKGRSERVHKLVALGKVKSFEELFALIKAEYPNSTESKVKKIYAKAVAAKSSK